MAWGISETMAKKSRIPDLGKSRTCSAMYSCGFIDVSGTDWWFFRMVPILGKQVTVFFVGTQKKMSGGRKHSIDRGKTFRNKTCHGVKVFSFYDNQQIIST